MSFEIVGTIYGLETISSGHGIRDLAELQKRFGHGKWRKVKGFATVRLADGRIAEAEIHWYELTESEGVGSKIKRYMD
jgi:hypothetical protein